MIIRSMTNPTVAYFSLEMMLESDIPTYAGGLGVLAGDILRSCADLQIPAVGVSLVYSGDTFYQSVTPDGSQTFLKQDWQKLDQLTKLPDIIEITLADTQVKVGCWRYDIVGLTGFVVPVYLLDTNLTSNPGWIRDITKNLYATGDYRLMQEILIGFGGIKMLSALGFISIPTYHLNEGHTALVTLALLTENNYQDAAVKKRCVFTTHTPIPEGHDKFPYDTAYRLAGNYLPWHIKKLTGETDLSLSHLALNLSRKSFAVSRKHRETSKKLFPAFDFDYITNGIHHRSWTHNHLQDVYNQYLPGWLENPSLLANSYQLKTNDLWQAHTECKRKLVSYVNHHLLPDHPEFNENTLTISLARRPVAYKRPLLLYHDLERLSRIGQGRLQIIQCGKSHPDDDVSQSFVRQIIEASNAVKDKIKICYLENYSPKIARTLVSGSDVWLNTPTKPLEASGTSGMKAAINGVLNFSILDGWWIEGFARNPQSGWAINPAATDNNDDADANSLYTILESEIIPAYYNRRDDWIRRMQAAITLGAHFNSHRVVQEYQAKAWTP
ncbi:MAG: alpha-glucan phosphorylase [Microgenomates group bacterium Gr01-1014_16]|nr:MAG: alpha-glucan phosphorylase [Microgenomates group bacterium Gr01-1014_16]